MKTFLYITALLLAVSLKTTAQDNILRVLQSVDKNNKTLQSYMRLTETRQLEAKTGYYPANPSVEFDKLWGDRNTPGSQYELTVTQSFDFPTVYTNKSKVAGLKMDGYNYQAAQMRRDILLQTQQTCLEIIWLRKQQTLLSERLENTLRLSELYTKKMAQGDANQLEINKIQLELINAQNKSRINDAALRATLEKLNNLNGGIPLDFTDTGYPVTVSLPSFEQLQEQYIGADFTLKNMNTDVAIANKEVSLNRAQSLPKFEVGYRRDAGAQEAFNGIRLGLSIPLFENKNNVRRAKAQVEYSVALVDDNMQNVKSNLRQLYEQAQALNLSRQQYAEVLATQRNIELLNKALEAGQISTIDYFVELSVLYDTRENYLQVEKDYYTTVAQLLQYMIE